MKKIALCFFSGFSILAAAEPMVPGSMSTDRGGLKPAIVAYTDGGGVMLYTDKVNGGGSVIDNSAMNELVFKYGENAKTNNTTLQNQVKTIDGSISTAAEKALADQILTLNIQSNTGNSSSSNGSSSSSGGNNSTVPANGTACDDGNANTTNDIYTNGVCKGTAVASSDAGLNTAPNGLKYDNCEGGLKNYTDAVAYCSSKGMRLASGDTGGSGSSEYKSLPACTGTPWTWTSTQRDSFYTYVWGSGYDYTDNGNAFGVRCVK